MSATRISRSPDLKRLRDEGYEVCIREAHLVLEHVPYVTAHQTVAYGTLVSTLNLAGDATATPETHVVYFAGETPCDASGQPLHKVINGHSPQMLAPGLEVQFTFSCKPPEGYPDYYDKMTTYVGLLAGAAAVIDPAATAITFRVVDDEDDDGIFKYADTASSRAGIRAVSATLRGERIGIVGVGGTGSYVLDFTAKTPVAEIHLFDADTFLQHNAFRAPGAAAREDLDRRVNKAEHWAEQYSRLRYGVVPHAEGVTAENVDELRDLDFVFLCIDDGPAKRPIVTALEAFGIAFVDVGMDVSEVDGGLNGLIRATTSTPEKRDHVHDLGRISFGRLDANNDYNQNIQIAELNALNAAMAVIKWKKLRGFYLDFNDEHFSVYTLDTNALDNDDSR